MRILLVEDDERTAAFVRKGLEQEGYAVDVAHDGETGLGLGTSQAYDLAILDVMLPRLDGLDLLDALRKGGRLFPVLILSGKSSVEDRVKGLRAGGDDYLTKPFAFVELVARVEVLIRRGRSPAKEMKVLEVEDLRVDLSAHRVTRGGRAIELQALEFALLTYLMRNAGHVVSKTMIMDHVWNYNFDPQTNVVEARIYRLREKIDRTFDRALIHTVRGVGYVLRAEG